MPYFERDNHVHALDSFLLPLNIHSRGRFGGWKYEVANQVGWLFLICFFFW